MSRLDDLIERAKPYPMKENIKDAIEDLERWPHLAKRILDDLETVLSSWEDENVETGDLTPGESVV